MTVCVGVMVNDCLVFSADSAATIVMTDPNGVSSIANVFQNGDKVYNLHRNLPVVAMTCGMGNIGSVSISQIAKEIRYRLMNNDPAWNIDPINYTMLEIAEKAREILFVEHYAALNPPPPAPHSLEFWVGGYPSDRNLPAEVWKISIVNGQCAAPQLQVQGGCTIFFGGQSDPIFRLLYGVDPSAADVMIRAGAQPPQALQVAQLLQTSCVARLVSSVMPVRDAIDLADFLVETTKRYFRFLPGADIVGGDTDIAVVTRYEGFKWIRRKHFYPGSLNPREVDHV